nr:MAG TPA: hypothetical protein [Caudoviricetes sp.]
MLSLNRRKARRKPSDSMRRGSRPPYPFAAPADGGTSSLLPFQSSGLFSTRPEPPMGVLPA